MKEVGQEEEQCVSASRMRGEDSRGRHALTESGCGEEGQRGEPQMRGGRGCGGGIAASSKNNANVEQAGDRCFMEGERVRNRREEKDIMPFLSHPSEQPHPNTG